MLHSVPSGVAHMTSTVLLPLSGTSASSSTWHVWFSVTAPAVVFTTSKPASQHRSTMAVSA
ncbi:hypothetical protein [Tessaracoccus massiliensis]|uniref:hypothetical protein n=1 Tax=Tessaracoccus massiliensis TaxID=1522311 RepID=UPI00059052B0|nr:hypothetical protein [Tessaracoccus massiliensis]